MKNTILILFAAASFSAAADVAAEIDGAWIAEVSSKSAEPQYARVTLHIAGTAITGTWNQLTVTGAASGDRVNLSLLANGSANGSGNGPRNGAPAGTLALTANGSGFSGEGRPSGGAFGGGRGRGGGTENTVAIKLTRPPIPPPGGPRTVDYEPRVFYGYYSASNPPALRIFPGDTVRTRTFDASGRDNDRRTPGGNLETGPFYIEGALPGDTLVVKLNRIRVNRDSARQGSRINGRTVTPAYVAAAQYDPGFDGEWKLDREKGIAILAHPTPRMKNFLVPILPMLGCIATAPPGDQVYRGTDLGPFGGNMDYNQMGEGVTLYLPVFHPGGLLTMGDAHAAMGDGELTGSALETSVDVAFTVDLIPGFATAGPRLENADYLMAMGVAGSIADSIQVATTQLVEWLKREYKLNDSETAVLLGAVLKYDITEMVDPQFNVVAKVPKSALKVLQ
jgi:acetamidase/formamidase